MTMSERDRRAVKLGAAALAAMGVYFGVVEPIHGRYQRLVDWHRASAEKIKRNIEEQRRLAVQEEQVKSWEEKVGPLLVERTYSEQMTTVGSRILAAAGDCQVQIQGVTPTPATPWVDSWAGSGETGGPSLEQATINFEAQGGWENAFKFVAALYRIEGVLSIEQIELSSDPKKGGQLTMRLAMSVLMRASAEGKR